MARVMRMAVLAAEVEVLRDAGPFYTSVASARCLCKECSLQIEQFQPLHLARRALGQGGDQAQQARRLVAPKLRQAMRAQFRLVASLPGLEDDAGEDVLAVDRIGNPHGRRLEHGGMAQQRLVDLAWRDVLAALDDQLLE